MLKGVEKIDAVERRRQQKQDYIRRKRRDAEYREKEKELDREAKRRKREEIKEKMKVELRRKLVRDAMRRKRENLEYKERECLTNSARKTLKAKKRREEREKKAKEKEQGEEKAIQEEEGNNFIGCVNSSYFRVKEYRRRQRLSFEETIVEDLMKCDRSHRGKEIKITRQLEYLLSEVVELNQLYKFIDGGLIEALKRITCVFINNRAMINNVLQVMRKVTNRLDLHRAGKTKHVIERCTTCGWIKSIFSILHEYRDDIGVTEICLGIGAFISENTGFDDINVADMEILVVNIIYKYSKNYYVVLHGLTIMISVGHRAESMSLRNTCDLVYKLLASPDHDDERGVHATVREAMKLVDVLVANSCRKKYLIELGIKKVIDSYDKYNKGIIRSNEFELGSSIASRVWNKLNN
jgi:hypothetical protein